MFRFLHIFLCCTLVIGSAFAADWSQNQWQILYTSSSDSLMTIRGLDCSDGVVHLVLIVQDSSDYIHFSYRRWSPSGGYLGEQEWPEDLRLGFREINYASYTRQHPAFLSTTNLWRQTSGGWDSLHLTEEDLQPQCFTYDSANALHYLLRTNTDTYDLHYRRTGGVRPPRQEVFHCNFELGYSGMSSARICAPGLQSVFFAAGVDDALLDLRPNFWSVNFYHSYINFPFTYDSLLWEDWCYYGSPQLVLSPRGEWIYGLRQMPADPCCSNLRLKVWIGGDGLPGLWQYPVPSSNTTSYRIFDNAFDSTFEIGAAVEGQVPVSLVFARFNPEWQEWEEYHVLDLPTDHATFHVMVDSLGRGHLFTVDSTHLWYYGPPASSADDPFDPNPSSFALSAYPNPFNPTTTITFSLPQTDRVTLAVYDVTGREIRTLVDRAYPAGEYQTTFDGAGLPSDIYLARLTAGEQQVTQKLLLVR